MWGSQAIGITQASLEAAAKYAQTRIAFERIDGQ